MTARGRKEPSFEEAMERLEQIVAEIESEKLGLERQFELFREGMELARFCERIDLRPLPRAESAQAHA